MSYGNFYIEDFFCLTVISISKMKNGIQTYNRIGQVKVKVRIISSSLNNFMTRVIIVPCHLNSVDSRQIRMFGIGRPRRGRELSSELGSCISVFGRRVDFGYIILRTITSFTIISEKSPFKVIPDPSVSGTLNTVQSKQIRNPDPTFKVL